MRFIDNEHSCNKLLRLICELINEMISVLISELIVGVPSVFGVLRAVGNRPFRYKFSGAKIRSPQRKKKNEVRF
jgi:hypothetical protein